MPRCRENYRRRKRIAKRHAELRARPRVLYLPPGDDVQFLRPLRSHHQRPRLYIADDAGNWQEVGDVSSVQISRSEPDAFDWNDERPIRQLRGPASVSFDVELDGPAHARLVSEAFGVDVGDAFQERGRVTVSGLRHQMRMQREFRVAGQQGRLDFGEFVRTYFPEECHPLSFRAEYANEPRANVSAEPI